MERTDHHIQNRSPPSNFCTTSRLRAKSPPTRGRWVCVGRLVLGEEPRKTPCAFFHPRKRIPPTRRGAPTGVLSPGAYACAGPPAWSGSVWVRGGSPCPSPTSQSMGCAALQ
ncbi:hypothetical protein P175DRAFT_0125727 [Aspergillus ochraceoroseus IBT 24754]|uniref:Uncharacterized protein n=1 Tax=Aspergillus ochraceoroseus IBT 24754 TaxID=1392256 RepID=A0A2T5LKM7_9EURO|nr:uncharacterized protein P175DRAFT_0125727 [Aspergillus ochraceoroseus IBT 24754]PTU16833.1 hypothetical protein P175DRAFT_0125727 [Aspergillus ochraceoroseus IBT 24754]